MEAIASSVVLKGKIYFGGKRERERREERNGWV
jgi:hypothetical protein